MPGKKDPTSVVSKKTPSDLPVPSSSSSPTEFPTPAEVSSMLAKEMNQLSVEEREKVLEDVHGIARVVDEPQEFIEACLTLLEKELTNIPSKVAYDLAKFRSKEYVSSQKLLMMFLRADSFDAYKAASRMVRFFEEKYALFGAQKLTKDIVLADLDPDDIAAVESGIYQVLPEKDSAGRKVFFFFPKLKGARTTQNQLRALYYFAMSNVEDDEEAQKRGVVGGAYCVGGGVNINPQLVRKKANLRNALPIRTICAQVCYDDQLLYPFFSLAAFLMGTHTRMRFRAHYGSHEECLCRLSSFGIPISALPVSSRGEFNLENHRTFMAMRRAIEATKSKWNGHLGVDQEAKKKPMEKAASRQPIIKDDVLFAAAPKPNNHEPTAYGALMGFSNNFLPSFPNPWWSGVGAPNLPQVTVPPHTTQFSVPHPASHTTGPTSASLPPAKLCKSPANPYVIYDPLPNDILFGRGKPIQGRPANVRFREMLDKNSEKYANGGNGGKAIVSTYIVHLVKEEGGRFLKELEDGGWGEVDAATAQAKVSQAFRTRRQVFQATLKKNKSIA